MFGPTEKNNSNMFKQLATVLLVSFTFYAHAQLIVGVPNSKMINGKPIDDQTMRSLKATETIFFYGQKDSAAFAKHGEVIKKYWKVNKLTFAPLSDFSKYPVSSGKYSYFFPEMKTLIKTMSSGTPYVAAVWTFLDLKVPTQKEYESVSRLMIGPDIEDLIYLYQNYLDEPELRIDWASWGKIKPTDHTNKLYDESAFYLHNEAQFSNFYPGLFMLYLKEISDKLINEETQGVLAKPEDELGIAALADKTLIIPEGILTEYKKFRDEFVPRDREDFFKDYPYKYEVKTYEEINEMLLTEFYDDDKYILVPAIINTDQYMNIYSTKGEWIYKDMDPFTKDYSSKDLKKIAKAIAKAAKG